MIAGKTLNAQMNIVPVFECKFCGKRSKSEEYCKKCEEKCEKIYTQELEEHISNNYNCELEEVKQ